MTITNHWECNHVDCDATYEPDEVWCELLTVTVDMQYMTPAPKKDDIVYHLCADHVFFGEQTQYEDCWVTGRYVEESFFWIGAAWGTLGVQTTAEWEMCPNWVHRVGEMVFKPLKEDDYVVSN